MVHTGPSRGCRTCRTRKIKVRPVRNLKQDELPNIGCVFPIDCESRVWLKDASVMKPGPSVRGA